MVRAMPKKAQNMRRLFEEHVRSELDGTSRHPANDHLHMHQIADGLPAVVGALEQEYLRDGNPVHVWNAIVQLHLEAVVKAKQLVLPNWILAYLVQGAQGIMGTAVNRPSLPQAGSDMGKKIRKSRTPSPERRPDGSTHFYSDWFGGCTASERLKLANQALGFTNGQGSLNAFELAHRLEQERELLRSANAVKRAGATDTDAVEQVRSDALRRAGDKVRKLRTVRRKHGQGPKLP